MVLSLIVLSLPTWLTRQDQTALTARIERSNRFQNCSMSPNSRKLQSLTHITSQDTHNNYGYLMTKHDCSETRTLNSGGKLYSSDNFITNTKPVRTRPDRKPENSNAPPYGQEAKDIYSRSLILLVQVLRTYGSGRSSRGCQPSPSFSFSFQVFLFRK